MFRGRRAVAHLYRVFPRLNGHDRQPLGLETTSRQAAVRSFRIDRACESAEPGCESFPRCGDAGHASPPSQEICRPLVFCGYPGESIGQEVSRHDGTPGSRELRILCSRAWPDGRDGGRSDAERTPIYLPAVLTISHIGRSTTGSVICRSTTNPNRSYSRTLSAVSVSR